MKIRTVPFSILSEAVSLVLQAATNETIEKTSHQKIYRVISNGRVKQNALETLMSLNNVEIFRESSNIKHAFNKLIQPFSKQ